MGEREVVVGNYVLRELIGRGGMADVHAAEHRFLGDRVAIKQLRADVALDEEHAAAFVAEGVRTRTVVHPNVVRVLDVGRDAAGRCYLVMERITGPSLAEHLRKVGPLAEEEAVRLALAITAGMQAVHDCGIVHRDLKPANIMLDGDTPKIVDFGIAKSLGGRSAAITDRQIGTLAYMAPEQLAGGVITPAVDVWALGVMLFEAVTGSLPFPGFKDGHLPQLVERAPRAADVAAISPALDRVIARCLEKDVARRFGSMAEVARALRGEGTDDRLTEDLGPVTPREDSRLAEAAAPTLHTRRRRRGWLVPVAGVAVVAGAIAVAFAATRPGSSPSPSPSPISAERDAPRTPSVAPVASNVPIPTPDAAVAAPANVDIDLRTTPRGAKVLVDGAWRGETPMKLSVPVGSALAVSLSGYRRVDVRVERAGPIQVDLVKLPRAHVRTHRPGDKTHGGETLD